MVKMKGNAAYDCDLNDKQHMIQLVRELNRNPRVIDELCEEGERLSGDGNNVLRAAWQQDVIERLSLIKHTVIQLSRIQSVLYVFSVDGNCWRSYGYTIARLHHYLLGS